MYKPRKREAQQEEQLVNVTKPVGKWATAEACKQVQTTVTAFQEYVDGNEVTNNGVKVCNDGLRDDVPKKH